MKNLLVMLSIMYLLQWIIFIIGYMFIRSNSKLSSRLEKYIWNTRIDAMQKYPLKLFMDAYSEKNYFKSMIFVITTNIGMVIVQLISGLVLLSPLIVIYQGFMMGAIVAQGDKKTKIFSYVVCIFELGEFAFAGGLSLYVGVSWIFNSNFHNALTLIVDSGLYLLPLLCLILNGVIEAAGVFLDIEGIPGVKAVKEKLYK